MPCLPRAFEAPPPQLYQPRSRLSAGAPPDCRLPLIREGRSGSVKLTNGGSTTMAKVTGLGHVGLFVTDPKVMTEFYRDFLGMTLTDKADNDSIIFFSTHPQTEH